MCSVTLAGSGPSKANVALNLTVTQLQSQVRAAVGFRPVAPISHRVCDVEASSCRPPEVALGPGGSLRPELMLGALLFSHRFV